MGQPACYHNIAAAIQDINIYAGFDSLVLCIDSEELSVAEKITEIQTELARILRHQKYQYKSLPKTCNFTIIVQQVCIETWFGGNTNLIEIADEFETETLQAYKTHFDVSTQNPEEMPLLETTNYNTKAQFHERYFREIIEVLKTRCRNKDFYGVKNISYSKGKPHIITKNIHFLYHLQERLRVQPTHLQTFKIFSAFCESLK